MKRTLQDKKEFKELKKWLSLFLDIVFAKEKIHVDFILTGKQKVCVIVRFTVNGTEQKVAMHIRLKNSKWKDSSNEETNLHAIILSFVDYMTKLKNGTRR
jgi:hypothetical protein